MKKDSRTLFLYEEYVMVFIYLSIYLFIYLQASPKGLENSQSGLHYEHQKINE